MLKLCVKLLSTTQIIEAARLKLCNQTSDTLIRLDLLETFSNTYNEHFYYCSSNNSTNLPIILSKDFQIEASDSVDTFFFRNYSTYATQTTYK